MFRNRIDKNLFIVTIASEKGGVGKTTTATNLAVYLKALYDNLAVTILSFDNHFSVDSMFAIGPPPPFTVNDLLVNTVFNIFLQKKNYAHLVTPLHGWAIDCTMSV